MKKYYTMSPERFYNHGCKDYAIFEDCGNGKAVCIQVESCSHRIHELEHQYCILGEIMDVDYIISDRDYVEDEDY